ncbi:MAG TPA: glycoside hydrolase family 15 protein [Bacteroidales bacterium]|nr:glycoside hydrolase family 15 protein [Bacteroidales bacterium]
MARKILILPILIISVVLGIQAQNVDQDVAQSYFKLTTSNGLIVGIYNSKENRIDNVYPHIFAAYDSTHYVYPFIGNIKLATREKPIRTSYLGNTHVINVQYKSFAVNYLSSFTRNDKVFYIVARGKRDQVQSLTLDAETEAGKPVSGITLLENHLQDLPIHIRGKVLQGTFLRKYNADLFEKYFLFSFTDSLHQDTTIVTRTIAELARSNVSIVDAEVDYMKKLFSGCTIPDKLTSEERNVAEQSVSILKMSQVSDAEILPNSRGQVLASLRPGLWHVAWVRDGSFAIQAMTRLGMFTEARKALEFMLKAPSGKYKNYIYKDGKDYGPGMDYKISLTRYFGNGEEECDYNEHGPNIEYDDFGLFMITFCDYVDRSRDIAFYMKWNKLMCEKVADVTVHIIEANSLIKADSGPWEHHLQMPKQYTFTSGVCARGLEMFASLQKQNGLPHGKYEEAASRLRQGILKHMLVDNRYFKGNASDMQTTDHEYFDSGAFEIFANQLIRDKKLFLSHMTECDNYLRIKGNRPGYIRLNSNDPYENQEWVFINLRISMAHLLFGQRDEAGKLLNYITSQAKQNYNTIPEMISNKLQMTKVPRDAYSWNVWCNCIRQKDDQYIGTIPMVGYGSGAYILTLYEYYEQK